MMSKGENLSFLNTQLQTYVLKLNICCDGCKIKVKKLLQKIDGVYTISIDAEKGKVTVSGSAPPATLIKKLCKAGKRAELLGAKNGNSSNNKNSCVSSNFHEQLQKLQLQQKGNGNPQKNGGGKDQKGQQQLQQSKGFQVLKLPQMKDQKNVKFSLPSEDEDGSDYDYDDDMYDSEDDYDDGDLDDFEDDHRHSNMKPMKNDKKGGGGGGDVSMLNKLMGSIGGGKKESHGSGGGGNKDGKSGGDKNKKGAPRGNGKDNNGGKKGGGATGGAQSANFNPKMPMGGQSIRGMNTGKTSAPMGHSTSLSAGGMPPPACYQGGMAAPAVANPYHHHQQQQQQQQHMAAMQQRMQYGQQPMMAYGQPPMGLPHPAYGEPAYAHYFSDENPNSCCVM